MPGWLTGRGDSCSCLRRGIKIWPAGARVCGDHCHVPPMLQPAGAATLRLRSPRAGRPDRDEMNRSADVIILGAGTFGPAPPVPRAARPRAARRSRGAQPAATPPGRSAATFFETYGNAAVRAGAREPRLPARSAGHFVAVPLMIRRDALFIATQRSCRPARVARGRGDRRVTHRRRRRRGVPPGADPAPDYVAGAALRRVRLRHRRRRAAAGLPAQPRAAGAQLVTDIGFEARIERTAASGAFTRATATLEAPVLVNAAGAGSTRSRGRAGVATVGLQPLQHRWSSMPAPPGGARAGRW